MSRNRASNEDGVTRSFTLQVAGLLNSRWLSQSGSFKVRWRDRRRNSPSIHKGFDFQFLSGEKEDAFRVPSLSHHYAYLIPSRFLRRLPPRFVLRQYSQSYSQSRFSARSLLLFFFSSWRCRVYTSRNASQVEKRRQRTHHHHPRNGRHVSSHDNSTQKLWK